MPDREPAGEHTLGPPASGTARPVSGAAGGELKSTPPGDGRGSQRALSHVLIGWAQRNGLFFALIVLIVVFSLTSPRFLTSSNIPVILLQVAVTGLVAVPGAMLLLSGYVDLSVGSVGVLAAIVFGQCASSGTGTLPASLIGLAVGAAWGFGNGWLISYLDFSPIVVTLGGLAGARGVAEVISDGLTTNGFGNGFDTLGNGSLLGVDIPVWIAAGAFVAGAVAWYLMPYGRYMTAIGADREAARSLGIRVRRIPLLLYVVSGLAAALGGLILASQLDSASLSIGTNQELDVLTAILLGGVSFVGGRGSLFGVLCGVLFIGVLDDGLVLLNINPFVVDVATGAALVFAAGLDVLYRRLERIELGVVEIATADEDDDDEPVMEGTA